MYFRPFDFITCEAPVDLDGNQTQKHEQGYGCVTVSTPTFLNYTFLVSQFLRLGFYKHGICTASLCYFSCPCSFLPSIFYILMAVKLNSIFFTGLFIQIFRNKSRQHQMLVARFFRNMFVVA